MKKFKFFAFLMVAAAGLFFAACDNGEDVQENNYLITVTFDEDGCSDLIDSEQYGGSLLYSGNAYTWSHAATSLTGGVSDGLFYNGGSAISDYVNDDYSSADYTAQLEVAELYLNNFLVVYNEATLKFADGIKREIYNLYVYPTNYMLNVAENGNDYGSALVNEGDYFTVTFTALNSKKSVDVDIARDGTIISEWTEVDLSSLGKVEGIVVSFSGSDTGAYGLNTPAYIAIDEIGVLCETPYYYEAN